MRTGISSKRALFQIENTLENVGTLDELQDLKREARFLYNYHGLSQAALIASLRTLLGEIEQLPDWAEAETYRPIPPDKENEIIQQILSEREHHVECQMSCDELAREVLPFAKDIGVETLREAQWKWRTIETAEYLMKAREEIESGLLIMPDDYP